MNIYKAFNDISLEQTVNTFVEVFREMPQAKTQLMSFTLRWQYSLWDNQRELVDENQFATFIIKCKSNYIFVGVQDGEKFFNKDTPIEYLSYHDSGWREATRMYLRKKLKELTAKYNHLETKTSTWSSFNTFFNKPKWIYGDIIVNNYNEVIFVLKNINTESDIQVGDPVFGIKPGDVCDSYPLDGFQGYQGQKRNNSITTGRIIGRTPSTAPLPTVMVEHQNEVVLVRLRK